jgi:hypothetical protein
LNAKIVEHELENEKFKFACNMLYNGRHPFIKDSIDFQPRSQNNIKLNPMETRFLTLLRTRLPWCKIENATFYILRTILSTRLEEFMLRNLIMLLIMLTFTKMRFLVLVIQLMLKCLRKSLLMHQMNLLFHLRPLMHPLFSLTNQAK